MIQTNPVSSADSVNLRLASLLSIGHVRTGENRLQFCQRLSDWLHWTTTSPLKGHDAKSLTGRAIITRRIPEQLIRNPGQGRSGIPI
jgi:hypothetical protein